jgi:hypothetical protein
MLRPHPRWHAGRRTPFRNRRPEIVADLLSTEAVRIKPGAPVRIDGWGGPLIQGRVKRVDPAGFKKISALGIEEQRVSTIVDFADPPEAWSALGQDFRVNVLAEQAIAAEALGLLQSGRFPGHVAGSSVVTPLPTVD